MPQPSVYIPQFCLVGQQALTPTEAGRHCPRCQPAVIDLTHLSEAEMLAHLARRPWKWVRTQPATPVVALRGPKRWLGRWLLVAAVFVTKQQLAAAEILLVQAVVPKADLSAPTGSVASDSLTISGIVKKPNGAAASQRLVTLSGIGIHDETALHTTTDSQGRFHFTIAADSLQQYPSLSCLYIPKPGWHFQTAGEDVDVRKNGLQTYVLHLRKQSKLARWWALRHPSY